MLHIKYVLTLGNPLLPCRKQDPLTALAIGSSIVGGIGNMFGQQSANETNLAIARENRDWQSSENQKARDFQLDMWNKQNEYNTPAHQRQLAQEAGYNPYLLSSQGSLGSGAGSAGVPGIQGATNSPHIEPINPFGGISSLMDAVHLANEKEQVDSSVDSNKANIAKTLSEIAINAYKELGQKGLDDVLDKVAPILKGLNFGGSRSDQLFNETVRGLRLDNARKELDNEFQEIENNWSNFLYADKHLLNSDQHKQFVATLGKIKAEVAEILSRSDLNKAQKERVIQEKIGVSIENGLKGLDFQNRRELQEEIQEMTLEELWKLEDERYYRPFDKDYQYQGKVGEYFPFPSGQYESSQGFERNQRRDSRKKKRRVKRATPK